MESNCARGATSEQIEAHLAHLAESVDDPRAGLFGPGTALWDLARESICFLAGGRAALLQVAHPWVAQAVVDHSQAETDMAGRFQRTFEAVFAMVFGDLDGALASARQVSRVHERIRGELPAPVGRWPRGQPYQANDPQALMWVHATLMDSVFHVHQQVFGELSWNRRQDYYEESRRFARLFGVPDEVVPPDVDAFSAYMRHMLSSDILAVGPAGLQVRSYLFQSDRAVLRPAWRWYECMTSGLLPPRLREEFSMPWGRRNALVYRAGLRSFAAIVPRLPAQLRYLPAYLDACERLAGRSGRDPVARAAERLLMGILARS